MAFNKQVLITHSKAGYAYLAFLWSRCRQDNIQVPAGHLAYVTLLSLVPFLAVIFYMLSAFPMFSELNEIIEDLIYNNFVPTSGDAIKVHISGFIENTRKMSMMGIASLIVIALLLISTIDQTINRIWRCTHKRSMVQAFTIYWTILSLGPIIIAASIALSFLSFCQLSRGRLSFIGAALIEPDALYFYLVGICRCLYSGGLISRVSFRYALLGGFVAALLFFFGDRSFSFIYY